MGTGHVVRVKLPFREIHSFEDITRNFEALETQNIYTGTGAPTFTAVKGSYYFRTDTPTVANQRIYVNTTGSAWTGIV